MIEARSDGETLVTKAAQAFGAFQQGDRRAFDDLVATVTPLLWHTVRSQGVDSTVAEDVVQTVWMSLLHSADNVRDPQTVVKWLITSTRRESWRVTKRLRADISRNAAIFGVDGEEVLSIPVQRETLPDEVVLADVNQQLLWNHVQDLPERCRALIRVIAYADKPDYAQIAESLGMPVGSIGPTRGRCLAKLRDQLARDPEWEGTRS
ncbi:MAG TPA: sigma-70 family RNA polymerase sigma factor [Nocardioidaceae bacterium]|nr:sigma-70 family RNA polymerase sigma factor [Nocardioidaceae bacterium]